MTNSTIPPPTDEYATQQTNYGYPAAYEYPGQDMGRPGNGQLQQPRRSYASYQYPQPRNASITQSQVGFPMFSPYPQYRAPSASGGAAPVSAGSFTTQPTSYGNYYQAPTTSTAGYPGGLPAATAQQQPASGYAMPYSYASRGREDGLQRSVMRPKITTTMWEDEKTLCYQVEANGVIVVRRADNDMINGTKLLNVTKMTRGRRDGILKAEKIRHVVKIGSLHLKGIWIPFNRALAMARREGIYDILFPLFVKDIAQLIQQGTRVEASPETKEMISSSGSSSVSSTLQPTQNRYDYSKSESSGSLDDSSMLSYNTYKSATPAQQQQPLYYVYPGYQVQNPQPSVDGSASSAYFQRQHQPQQQGLATGPAASISSKGSQPETQQPVLQAHQQAQAVSQPPSAQQQALPPQQSPSDGQPRQIDGQADGVQVQAHATANSSAYYPYYSQSGYQTGPQRAIDGNASESHPAAHTGPVTAKPEYIADTKSSTASHPQ